MSCEGIRNDEVSDVQAMLQILDIEHRTLSLHRRSHDQGVVPAQLVTCARPQRLDEETLGRVYAQQGSKNLQIQLTMPLRLVTACAMRSVARLALAWALLSNE